MAIAERIDLVYSRNMTVGERLRKARAKLKKRQADIAAELGVKQPTVWEWENAKDGAGSVPAHRILEVAKAYGVDPIALLPKKAKGAA